MAERRMFAKSIVLSDAFLDMPLSARCLYFTLGMLADDDGFVNNPKSIMRQCGASQDDMVVLLQKRFLLSFESGVIVIKHWRVNNYLRSDRYISTKYEEEMAQLKVKKNGAYSLALGADEDTLGIPMSESGIPSIGKDRIGKDSIDKNSIEHNNIYITSAESLPKKQTQQEEEAPVECLPLADGSAWRPTLQEYDEYCRLFPSVDIDTEFRKMRAWCLANSRKTVKGIRRFVNGWLTKAQDRPKTKAETKSNSQLVNEYLLGVINGDIT